MAEVGGVRGALVCRASGSNGFIRFYSFPLSSLNPVLLISYDPLLTVLLCCPCLRYYFTYLFFSQSNLNYVSSRSVSFKVPVLVLFHSCFKLFVDAKIHPL